MNACVLPVIAAEIDAGANANGALRRFERAGILLRLCVRDTVAAKKFPGARDGAKPVFHLRDDEAAELLVSELLDAEDGNGDERFSSGSVRRRDFGDDSEIVNGAGAIAIKNEHGTGNGRFLGRIIEAGDAARGGLSFTNKVRSAGAFHSDHNGASAEFLAAGEREFIFVKAVYMRIQTNRIGGKFCGELCGNRAHATGGDGRGSFREHFENEFEHTAGGFEFGIEKNAAEKRPEETVDEFLGKSKGLKRIFCGPLGAGKDFFDGFAAEA